MKFRRWVKEVGLPKGISVHSLRATFACHLIEKGVDIYTVSKLLGHSSVKVTERHYLALDPKHVQEAVARLAYGQPQQPNREDLVDDDDGNVGPI
jgi:integrase